MLRHKPRRTAIFVALPEELQHAVSVLKRHGTITGDPASGAFHYIYTFRGVSAGFAEEDVDLFLISAMGNVSSAAFVSAAVSKRSYELAVLAGISGSLDEGALALSDVLVSNHVKHHFVDKVFDISKDDVDNGRIRFADSSLTDDDFDRMVSSRPTETMILNPDDTLLRSRSAARFRRDKIVFDPSTTLIAEFLRSRSAVAANAENPRHSKHKVCTGCILGTNYVVDSENFVRYLHWKNANENRDYSVIHNPREAGQRNFWDKSPILAVDMESYGFFKALSWIGGRTQIPGVAIRGISDLAHGKGDLDKATKGVVRRTAVENAVTVTLELLQHYYQQNVTVSG